jgi:hypothetical protein
MQDKTRNKEIIMNAKEFDDMEADLKYRKHLKYSQADMDEALNQWVSVEERLPEIANWSGDRVLVYTEEGAIHTGIYEGEPADNWPDKFNDSGYITHWQPLPSPPK